MVTHERITPHTFWLKIENKVLYCIQKNIYFLLKSIYDRYLFFQIQKNSDKGYIIIIIIKMIDIKQKGDYFILCKEKHSRKSPSSIKNPNKSIHCLQKRIFKITDFCV